MSHTISIEIDQPFAQALQLTKDALAASGFGILTEIDLQRTLKEKIDADIDEQVILGACNPGFAHRGLAAEPTLGVLLPCSVVVRRADGRTVVESVDPRTMVELTGNRALEPLAEQVSAALHSALERLPGGP